MSIEVQLAIDYGFRWALCFGHATSESKHVAPEYGSVYHFYDNDGGKILEWNYGVINVNGFLHGAGVSLNFWDVLISSSNMRLCMQISKVVVHLLELVFCEHDSNSKSPSGVSANQGFEMFKYVAVFHAIQLVH